MTIMDSENEEELRVLNSESFSSSDEESASSEEEFESDDEENADSGFDAVLDDSAIYKKLMDGLEQEEGFGPVLKIETSTDARVMLEHIDSFCTVLSSTKRLPSLQVGDAHATESEPKIEIDEENAAAWDMFFSSFADVEKIDELLIRGFNVSTEVVVQILVSTSHLLGGGRFMARLFLPWSSTGDDLSPLVEAVSDFSCENIGLVLCANDGIPEVTSNVNHFDGGNIFNLIHGHPWRFLGLICISFTMDQSKSLGRILSDGTCIAREVVLSRCAFQNNSGEFVAKAIAESTIIQSLMLFGNDNDDSFENSFLQSFPSNASVQELKCLSKISMRHVKTLIQNVARQNYTLKHMQFSSGYDLSTTQIQDLKEVISRNYTLEAIGFEYGEVHPFAEILRLNAAGRRYLAEDATSRSKCIAVMAKVKNELDCLYYHMKENPILCIENSRRSDGNAGKKRKANENAMPCVRFTSRPMSVIVFAIVFVAMIASWHQVCFVPCGFVS